MSQLPGQDCVIAQANGAQQGPPVSLVQSVLRSLGGWEGMERLPRLPKAGEQIFGFGLRQELGRGAFARVFLAEQADLAGRQVVLKVSAIKGHEPQTLAQLQHTHIVPIHSVHEDAGTGLRAVCMPYFGGASLSRVLQVLWAQATRPMLGKQLVQALEALQNPAAHAGGRHSRGTREVEGPRRHHQDPATPSPETAKEGDQRPIAQLRGLGYIQAVVWIVARLAEALQHAHQRGVLHRDVKPSNILMGADGQPMLLDFNLSQNLNSGQAQAAATLGGTVAYMAPEHLQALASRDRALAGQVDQRADIYSLGMVMYEMLAGRSPFDQSASYSVLPILIQAMAIERTCTQPSLRQYRSDVPWSLESIGRKCLDPEPARRYQRAEQLAEDLCCFLENRPLKHAPELSRVERIRKCLRRHPRLTSSGSVATAAALLLMSLGALTVGIREHLANTQQELVSVQAQERKRAYEAGTLRALCLVNTTTDLHDHLLQGLAVCEQTLALYGVLEREDWQEHPDWQLLDPADRRRLAEDTRELLTMLARARVRTAPEDEEVLRQALTLLDRAQAIQGLTPSRAPWEDRALYLDQLGEPEAANRARSVAKLIRPASARDHYLLATSYARNLRYAEAVEELDQALELNPRHYWSSFQRGICHLELGKYALAAGDFGACTGLWPEFAWGYFNRAAAVEKTGDKAEAVRDYTAALERDPGFLLAYLNRGMVRLDLKQYAEAMADFQKAAELGGDDASLHAGHGVALEKLERYKEADAAFQRAFARVQSASSAVRARIGCVYGFTISARLPQRAWEAFAAVLREQTDHPQALYGQAMLLVEQNKLPEALACFNRAIEVAPGMVEARRFRAITLARCGNFESASQDINWCLEKEPQSGATSYAAACVAARAAEKSSDPLAAKLAAGQAVAFLQKAIASGYGQDQLAKDPDLTGIRQHPGFQGLLAKVKQQKRAEYGGPDPPATCLPRARPSGE